MAAAQQLSRIALRRDQILEVQFGNWPEPLPEMLRLPGIQTWWNEMRLCRERDIQTFKAMNNNLGQANIDGGGP